MRDQETKRPRIPAPLVAVGIECLSCAELAAKSAELAEQFDGENKRLPPGVRVVMQPPDEE